MPMKHLNGCLQTRFKQKQMKRYTLQPPNQPIRASVRLDGSKSISNRLLILQNISKEPITIQNLSTSDDTRLMQQFFRDFPEKKTFNVQNAGTVTRFVTAFLAAQPGKWELTCAPPMKKRPIKILVDALRSLGGEIDYLEKEGYLPLHIHGKKLNGGEVRIAADVSSQYISALMMIAPVLQKGLEIHLDGEIASRPYLEITQRLMEQCGFAVRFSDQTIHIESGQKTELVPEMVFNESDWSAAAFYYTICATKPDTELVLSKLNNTEDSSQGDAQVTKIFEELGVKTTFQNQTVRLTHAGTKNESVSFDFIDKPDMVPAVAVACAKLGIQATFTGVKNLIIKESNRLKALQTELAKVGVTFEAITENEWHLTGVIQKEKISEVSFSTYEDHRMAMCFATLGFSFNNVTILEPWVVSKSYADFWTDMKELGLQVSES